MNIQNEKVFADKVLEQLDLKIDLVATKLMKRKQSGETSFLEGENQHLRMNREFCDFLMMYRYFYCFSGLNLNFSSSMSLF